MRYRERKKNGWKIAIAVVAIALLSCGIFIALAVQKVAAEKKFERKFAKEKPMAKTAPELPAPRDPDNN